MKIEMRKACSIVIAAFLVVSNFSIPSANASLVTISCSEGGSFTVDNASKTVVVDSGRLCAGTAIIPDGVLTIGLRAFRDAPVRSVRLPQGLTTISQQAFQRSALLTINIPNTVTSIGVIALSMPSVFNSVEFEPGGSTPLTLASGALQYFKGSCVVFPSNLTTMNFDVFDASLAIQNIYFSGDAPAVASNITSSSTPIAHHKTTATGFTNPWKGLATQAATFTTPTFTLSSVFETATTTSAINGYSINQTGGAVGCYSIFPAPAAGLSFNSSTGLLSGTPTATGAPTTYTITGANGAGAASRTFTLSVPPPPSFALSRSAETATTGVAIGGYAISSTGGAIASYSISPAAKNGLVFNSSTGLLSGTPTISDTGTVYTITGSNVSGNFATTYRVTVEAAPPAPPAPAAPPAIPDPPQSSKIESAFPTTGPISGGTQVVVTMNTNSCTVVNVSLNQSTLPASLWSLRNGDVLITMPPSPAGRAEITIWNGCVPVLPEIVFFYAVTPVSPALQTTTAETATTPSIPRSDSGLKETTTVSVPERDNLPKAGPLASTLTLKLFFALSSFNLDQRSTRAIQSLASQVSGLGSAITISITGYAQPTPGSEATDGALSRNRAAAVARSLRQLGVTTQIVYKGAGRAALNIPTSRYVEIIARNR